MALFTLTIQATPAMLVHSGARATLGVGVVTAVTTIPTGMGVIMVGGTTTTGAIITTTVGGTTLTGILQTSEDQSGVLSEEAVGMVQLVAFMAEVFMVVAFTVIANHIKYYLHERSTLHRSLST